MKKISFLFIFIGIVFLLLENIFYNSIQKNGILEESFFLPLGFFFIGFTLLFLFSHKIYYSLNKT
jgi:CHASE3 domain sensor protein